MKNLPLWTKTLAVASLALFGAAACDGGGGQDTADINENELDTGYTQEEQAGVIEEEDDTVTMDQGGTYGQGQEDQATMPEEDVDLYGQQGGTTGQDMQQGTQTDQQAGTQDQTGQTGDDTVVQRD